MAMAPLGTKISHGGLTVTFYQHVTWVGWDHLGPGNEIASPTVGSRIIKELDDIALKHTVGEVAYHLCLEANKRWIDHFDLHRNLAEAKALADALLMLELDNIPLYQKTMQRLYDYASTGGKELPKDLVDDYWSFMKHVPDRRT
jgi:hypothetical protein